MSTERKRHVNHQLSSFLVRICIIIAISLFQFERKTKPGSIPRQRSLISWQILLKTGQCARRPCARRPGLSSELTTLEDISCSPQDWRNDSEARAPWRAWVVIVSIATSWRERSVKRSDSSSPAMRFCVRQDHKSHS